MRADLNLYYGDLAVETIKSPFCSDDTWHGVLELAVSGSEGELDRYASVVKSGLWSTRRGEFGGRVE